MKRSGKSLPLLAANMLLVGAAWCAPVISLVPQVGAVLPLHNFYVDVVVSGLQSGGTNSLLGAFDLTLNYDPQIVQFLQIGSSLGVGLGDPDDTAHTFKGADASVPGSFRFYEVSLLEGSAANCFFCAGPYLEDLQNDSFLLAHMLFYSTGPLGPATGAAAFSLSSPLLADADGNAIGQVSTVGAVVNVIPEPSGPLLALGALMGAMLAGGKRRISVRDRAHAAAAPWVRLLQARFPVRSRMSWLAAASFALLAAAGAQAAETVSLASGTVALGNTVEFQGHRYYLAPQKGVSWDRARALAARETVVLTDGTVLKGHLLTINSQAEQNFVHDTFRNAVDPFGFGMIWLGGYQSSSDLEPLGNWAWITGEETGDASTQWRYSFFTPGEPADGPNPTLSNDPNPYNVEDALRLLWFCGNRCGRWDDFHRGDTAGGDLLRFVIEFDQLGDNFVQLRSPPAIVSNSLWRSNSQFVSGWQLPEFNDANWVAARAPYPSPVPPTDLMPGTNAQFMWHDPQSTSDGTTGNTTAFFRYTFNVNGTVDSRPLVGAARVSVDDDYDMYVNGTLVRQNHDGGFAGVVDSVKLSPYLRQGKNVIAIQAVDGGWGSARDRLFERVLIDAAVQPLADLLVVTGSFRHSVSELRRYDGRAGAYIGPFGDAGCNPVDAAYGPDHKLYVLDQPSNDPSGCTNSDLVRRFDGRTGQWDPADEFRSFVRPDVSSQGMAFGPDGNLYISGYVQGSIRRYQGPFGASPGQFIDTFVSPNLGGMQNPSQIIFGPDSNLYVVSLGQSVLRFQGPLAHSPGAFIDTFVPQGTGGLGGISDLAFGRDKMLYVASGAGVMRFQGPTGGGPGQFVGRFAAGASQLAFGADGDLFTDSRSGTVVRYDGDTGAAKGSFATGPGPIRRLLFSAVPNYAAGLGDFNRDGCVDQGDLALLTADMMGPAPHNTALYDLTGNGQVDAADARKMALLFTRPQGASCR